MNYLIHGTNRALPRILAGLFLGAAGIYFGVLFWLTAR
jgi:hypothetical protein